MKYQEYKKKMEKISKVLNVLYRFRFPIGGTILAILAGSLILTGLSGKAQNVVLESNKLVYGQSVVAYGKSIFGDADIEYSKAGENNWTSEVPYRAGNYQVRGVSKNGFGATTYTSPVDFAIAPKPLNVTLIATTIKYGGNITYSTDIETSRGDKIDNLTFTYGEEYDQVNPFGENDSFDTTVTYNTSTVKILDSNNEDVTYCYDLNVTPLPIKIQKRPLNLVSSATRKEYDGTPLTNENYYIDDDTPLASGDEITTMTPTTITDVGTTPINSTIVIKNGEKDRTSFYTITWGAPASLTVTKRNLSITTNSINRPYNGRRLSATTERDEDKLECSYVGLLTELGHELKNIEFISEGTYQPVHGSQNIIKDTFDIVDGTGESVKDCYNITINEGTINIDSVPLVITYDELNKLYDFTTDPLVGGVNQTGLVGTDVLHYTLEGTNTTSAITPDPLTFKCEDGSVYVYNNELDIDVTNCYDISYGNEYGYVQILSLPLTISTNPITTTYNGTPFSKDATEADRKLTVQAEGLQEGHHLEYAFSCEGSLYVNGTNTLATYEIVDDDTSADVTALYNIQFVLGEITTYKRNLTVTFDSNEWVYDGSSHLADHYTQEGLADTDIIELTSSYPVVSNYTSSKVDNYCEFNITNNGSIVDSYYNLTVTYGTLNVTRKELTIHYSVPESKMYDAEPILIDPSDVTIEGLDTTVFTYDLALNRSSIERYQDNGYDINIDSLNIYRLDDLMNPVTDNFSFKYTLDNQEQKLINPNGLKLGHVDIYKRPLNITTSTLEKKYDGLDLISDSYGSAYIFDNDTDLLSAKGHYVEMVTTTTRTFVGTSTNQITFRVMSPSGDVTDCYDLSDTYVKFGQLVITEKDDLVITFTNINSTTYNGIQQLPSSAFDYANLGSGDQINISYKTTFAGVNAGEYAINDIFDYDIIRTSSGTSVKYCYKDITVIGNPFIINKFELTVDMKNISKDLDTTIPDANSHNTHNTIPATDYLNLSFASNAKEVVEQGLYPDVNYTITNMTSGLDMSSNYNVTINPGVTSIDIIDVNLSIYPNCGSYSYSGEVINYGTGSQFWTYDYYTVEQLYNCRITGLQAEVEGEFKEMGDYTVRATNTDDIKIMRFNPQTNQYDEDVTAYFNIIFGSLTGTISINKASITFYETVYTKIYNGIEEYIPSSYFGGQLIEGHHIEFASAGAEPFKHPGTVYYVINDISDIVIKDAQGNDVTYLYTINVDYIIGQTISSTVNPYHIDVRTASVTKTFDGKVFSLSDTNFNGYESVFFKYDYEDDYNRHSYRYYGNDISADCYDYIVPTGDTIYYKYPVFTNYHVQVTQNVVDITVLDGDGNDVTDCYDIGTSFGTLRINQLQLSYSSNLNGHTYDGTNYSFTDYLKKGGSHIINFNLYSLPEELRNAVTNNSFYAYVIANSLEFMAGTYYDVPNFVFMYNNQDLVLTGDIAFVGESVTSTISQKTIIFSNRPNKTYFIDNMRCFAADEDLLVSGLLNGDVIYIGEEPYEEDKKDYAAIPNMTENKTYTPEDLRLIIPSSIIHIYRTVDGVRYEVTSCYDIQFNFNEIVVYNYTY